MNGANDISHFFAIGINYKKTDAALRGQFAISKDGYEAILNQTKDHDTGSLFVLSTCNRTEIYGFAERQQDLIDLLCTQIAGSKQTFTALAYTKTGTDAIEHLFNVAAGLDSQILGDYEITGQLKQAVKFARDRGHINCFMERLFNCVLQASKSIKNETHLSSGSVSVSFAATDFIRKHVNVTADTRILLIGTGKIGRNACKNLVDYLPTRNITLLNRSHEKAIELANELKLEHAAFNQLDRELARADIIVVSSSAEQPIVLASQLKNKGKKLIIDLSVPCNVEIQAGQLPNVSLVNIDIISRINDETLKIREAELPKARAIITNQLNLFLDWCSTRRNAPALNAIKVNLHQLSAHGQLPVADACQPGNIIERKIQQIVNVAAVKMRSNGQYGCHHLEALNEFMRIAV
ncbi:glutamyl-tRNA reductase [Mucilaginibacter sp. L3T2-6]|uniref:glutamyl-tRNA reductase n=1 Tax=Mucilaginibacter sp. L3T2-6 TaxID=3062491 RepID=UPI0026757BCA|nr:glutamyl-tRNA reductase [Mucilaginibacter sp. L3T2-6]MDO3644014.1 glutamyl-tRNA reductase [Mucilaginibacter sp. L3T2-6]MDV6216465.1 glutamyl-tRNA reductase [Mucilaginibacter sp. L3T2-6]